MSYPLKPWTRAAFELIAHAEQHLRKGGDFDRRVAMIGFDNALEVAITTYLGLHPIQRGGRSYRREDVSRWTENYHTKLDFLEQEAASRGHRLEVPCDEVVYFHKIRSDQYHTGGSGVPEAECISALRAAAFDIFQFLFDVEDVEDVIEEWMETWQEPKVDSVAANDTADWLIDDGNEPVVIAGQSYSSSEALRWVDPRAYMNVVAAISESRDVAERLRDTYPGMIRPELKEICFVHYDDRVFLKLVDASGTLALEDTAFIYDEDSEDECYFSSRRSPDENADRFIGEFGSYSILHCFEVFTEEAGHQLALSHELRDEPEPD